MSDSAHIDALREFFAVQQSEARRVFHGRGHSYPGLEHLCVDWYGPVLLVSNYAEQALDDTLFESIQQVDSARQIRSIVVQQRNVIGAPAETVWGEAVEEVIVLENGLRFEVHPGRRQNAGLFLDMRLMRQWLTTQCRGCNVLNLFAYTCSLSVAALAGGASQVVNVDVSKPSIAWGSRNHRLNGQDERQVKTVPHNLFTSWRRIQQYGRYDLVIIDPPTRQRGSFDASKDYAAVLKKLPKLLNPGGRFIAALNSPFLGADFVLEQVHRFLPEAELLERLPIAPEFPESDPEKGLKIFLFCLS